MDHRLKHTIADPFKTTEIDLLRIKNNLNRTRLADGETEKYLRRVIRSTGLEDITSKGKNNYFICFKYHVILTVNAHTYTMITAKPVDKSVQTQ